MKSFRAANALLRTNSAASNAISRAAPLVAASGPPACQCLLTPHATLSQSQLAVRPFSTTPIRPGKKDKKSKRGEEVEEQQPARGGGSSKKDKKSGKSSSGKDNTPAAAEESSNEPKDPNRPVPSAETPYDLSDLTYAFDRADKHYLDSLKTFRNGSRFSADSIGALPVFPDKKDTSLSYPLRDLATVAQVSGSGRKWSILCFDEASVKPIMSAVQKSPDFNQQPQRSEENPLELTITVEPERAEDLQKRVKELCQQWRDKLRAESHRREALHKKWKQQEAILEDDVKALKGKVQKMQDDRMKGVAAREKEVCNAVMARK
ncbi:ribosome recycling factor domain-containing protein [Neurospora tetraspora]|uniref:Ribosome recycling factor domain-containing protein n=1 Tax=Neurospora tetraspora TaxID=94610 RepID=A0AAE0J125_9PEZI|nr:ribosome recycling factor domain-containing protein [Neurospora tetraspora]